VASDLGQHCLAVLQADAAVIAQVMGGADGVVEAGDLSTTLLSDADKARTTAGTDTFVLAICVIDRGEERGVVEADVFVYDRHRGYSNIRAVRQLVIAALAGCPATLDFNRYIVKVGYAGRSGHLQNLDFDLDVERISFSGPLVGEVSTDPLY